MLCTTESVVVGSLYRHSVVTADKELDHVVLFDSESKHSLLLMSSVYICLHY